ncbi:Uncharacterised protein [Odoribacter splanchnicus]|nr:Uncharacterised protein [Odoribacter splanchnicus]
MFLELENQVKIAVGCIYFQKENYRMICSFVG